MPLIPTDTVEHPGAASNEEKIRLGIIGFGRIAPLHTTALTDNASSFDLVATADPSVIPDYEHVEHYEDYRDLLTDNTVQAVSILTPPNTHYSIAMAALEAGKNVLLEKPPALDVDSCLRMAALAQTVGRTLFMAFHARYRPEVEAAREQLSAKQVVEVQIDYQEDVLFYHSPDGWMFDPRVAGGGVLIDSGINALSIVSYVLPGVAYEVTEAKLEMPKGFKVETAAAVDFVFGADTKGHLSMDWRHEGAEVRQVRLTTDESDTYTIDIVAGTLQRNQELLTNGSQSGQSRVDLQSEYRNLYKDFARHVGTHRSNISTTELAFIRQAYAQAS